jgi:AcrR family transcriptional regulator
MSSSMQAGRPSLREERAQVTRRRIAQAARTLFARDGYGATTLKMVASEAGVAVQTVYAVFGSKAGILEALREGVVYQQEAASLFEAAVEEPLADQRLEFFARSIRQRWEQGADVIAIHIDAAQTDPGIRTEVDAVLRRRRTGLGQLADALEPDLAPHLDARQAAAILDALTLPELWAELVDVHGWTPDEYEVWLARALRGQLLGA